MCAVYEDLPLCGSKKHADEACGADPCATCAERTAAWRRGMVEAMARREQERRAERRVAVQRVTLREEER